MRVRVDGRLCILLVVVVACGAISAACLGRTVTSLWESLLVWLIIAAAAGWHELGHVAAAWGLGVRIRGLRMDILGARLELTGLLSYGQEFFVAAGGPFFSWVGAALVDPLAGGREGLELLGGVSLALGVVNLLPVGTLDGGRMLRCLAAWMWGDAAATTALRVTTGICLGGLWLVAMYALLRRAEMLSVFAFSLCLLWRAMGDGVLSRS